MSKEINQRYYLLFVKASEATVTLYFQKMRLLLSLKTLLLVLNLRWDRGMKREDIEKIQPAFKLADPNAASHRLPHCCFDGDICTTAQAPLAAESRPSRKQRRAN